MAAEFEEVIRGAARFETEHFGEESCNRFFGGRTGRNEFAFAHVGRRKSFLVQLAVTVQRNSTDEDDRCGHHVVGQPPGKKAAEIGGFRETVLFARNHVGDEAHAA